MIRLFRMQLRRDRLQLPIWIVLTASVWFASAGAIEQEFDPANRDSLLAVVTANPAIIAVRGLPDGSTTSALVYFQVFAFIAVVAGLMNTFLVTRHVRADEERGRTELTAATPVSRTATLRAALLLGLLADVVLAAACTLAQVGNGFDPVGSVLAGLAVGGVGIAFLGLGALAGQVMPTSRSANGAGVVLVLGAYLLRAIGDATGEPDLDRLTMTPAWPTWLSPIGWAELLSPYREQRVAVLLLLVAVAVLGAAAALALQARRDLGDSLVPQRAGRAGAARYLASSAALVWRQQWGAVIGWAVGGALFGLLAGSLGGALSDAAVGNSAIQRILQSLASAGQEVDIVDAFAVAVASMAGVLAAAAGIQAMLRMRGEETDGRAELLLAAPITRPGWLLGSLLVAVVSGAAVAMSMGVAGALAFAGTDPDRGGQMVLAGLAQLPTVAVFIGIAALAVAVLPRASVAIGWGALVLAYLLGPIGGILGLDDAVRDVSPFQHTPIVPGPDPDWGPAMIVLAVGAVLAALATVAMTRRQLIA